MMERERRWRALALGAGRLHLQPHLLPEHASSLLKSQLHLHHQQQQQDHQQQQLAHHKRPLHFFSEVCRMAIRDSEQEHQLSASHPLGSRTSMEAIVQGSRIHFGELRLRILQRLFDLPCKEDQGPGQTGQLALCVVTDLQQRHRFTLDSTIGVKADKHTFSSVLSSDFVSRIAMGLATSHRLGKQWSLFSRWSRDDYAGERILLQGVYDMNAKNTISTLCAGTIGGCPQAGFSWIHRLLHKEGSNESLQLKALYGGDGSYSVSLQAQVGVVDG